MVNLFWYYEFDPDDPELFIPVNQLPIGHEGAVLCVPSVVDGGGGTDRFGAADRTGLSSAIAPRVPCPPFSTTAYLQPPVIARIP